LHQQAQQQQQHHMAHQPADAMQMQGAMMQHMATGGGPFAGPMQPQSMFMGPPGPGGMH
jgi:hypothetical protein